MSWPSRREHEKAFCDCMKVIIAGHGRDFQCCLAVSAQFKGKIVVLLAYFSLFNFKFAENVYLRQVVSLEYSDSEKKDQIFGYMMQRNMTMQSCFAFYKHSTMLICSYVKHNLNVIN